MPTIELASEQHNPRTAPLPTARGQTRTPRVKSLLGEPSLVYPNQLKGSRTAVLLQVRVRVSTAITAAAKNNARPPSRKRWCSPSFTITPRNAKSDNFIKCASERVEAVLQLRVIIFLKYAGVIKMCVKY